MSISVSRISLVWLMNNILAGILLLLIKPIWSNSGLSEQILAVAVISLLFMIGNALMTFQVVHKVDLFLIFIMATYLFMFSQHILVLLHLNSAQITILAGRVSAEAIYETGFFVLFSIVLLNIGYLISENAHIQRHVLLLDDKEYSEISRNSLYYAGVVVYAIALIPTVYVLVRNIVLTATVGYAARVLDAAYQTSGVTNLPAIISTYMQPALISLLIARKPGQKWPVVAIAVYLVLYVLSGSRITAFVLLIGVLFIQTRLFIKLNFKKCIRIIAFIFVILVAFSVVSVVRSGHTSSLGSAIVEALTDSNPVISGFEEAGYTFATTATVLDNCPEPEPYQNGLSYISGVTYILPNFMTGNYFNRIPSTDSTFKNYLNIYGGIGSSYIAEAYWNFGYWGLLLMLLFGVFLRRMGNRIDRAISQKDYGKIYLVMFVFITIIFYVRSDTRTFFRNFVWFGLPIYLLYKQFYLGMVNREKSKAFFCGKH